MGCLTGGPPPPQPFCCSCVQVQSATATTSTLFYSILVRATPYLLLIQGMRNSCAIQFETFPSSKIKFYFFLLLEFRKNGQVRPWLVALLFTWIIPHRGLSSCVLVYFGTMRARKYEKQMTTKQLHLFPIVFSVPPQVCLAGCCTV